jgi:alkylation response protein AidB-like acyl-CoA dehydrogenase
VPIAISAEQRALQASIREWAACAGTLALVRGLEPGSGAATPGVPAGPPAGPAGPPPASPSPFTAPAGDTHQAAVRKLVGVAHRQLVAETALVLSGPDGTANDGPAGDAGYAFLLSRCLSIAGGTSQILLSVVAERALGLPRDEAR